MSEKGWIKLHRKIQDCWIWSDKPFDKGRAWIDLLLLAMHRDKKLLINDELLTVERGSFMTSILKLSERWGWSRNKTTRFLNELENEQMLHTKRTPKGTLLTIENYSIYQSGDITDDTTESTTHETTHSATDGTQKKNIKNDKNIKNNIMSISEVNALFEGLWKLYPRKKGKGQISDAKKHKIAEVGKEQMIRAIERYKRYVATQKDLSYQYGSTFFNSGYIDYLDENYVEREETPKNTKRTNFNNFEGRNYDMKSLEQQLLNVNRRKDED